MSAPENAVPPSSLMPETGGPPIGGDAAVVGDELILRILGGDPALDGAAADANLVLGRHPTVRFAEPRALGDADLSFDEVDTGDLFGHRVLDLNPWVDLDEVEAPGIDVEQELDRARVSVLRGSGESERGIVKRRACLGIEPHRRCGLDNLLVAALYRAVALEQVERVAVVIGQNLDLDMAGAVDQLFEEHRVVAEGGAGLAPRRADLRRELARFSHDPHAAAAPAPARLDHQGKADLAGGAIGRGRIGRHRRARGQHGNLGRAGERAGGDLVAERPQDLGRGADESQPGLGAGLGKIGVLGKESIAGMNGIDTGLDGDPENLVDFEIGPDRLQPVADAVAFIGLEPVQREAVLVRVDRDRADAEFGGGAKDADRDLAPVRDQQLANLAPSSFVHG